MPTISSRAGSNYSTSHHLGHCGFLENHSFRPSRVPRIMLADKTDSFSRLLANVIRRGSSAWRQAGYKPVGAAPDVMWYSVFHRLFSETRAAQKPVRPSITSQAKAPARRLPYQGGSVPGRRKAHAATIPLAPSIRRQNDHRGVVQLFTYP